MTSDIPSDALRDRVLDATLPNVAFDGWSLRAIRQGLEDAGLEADLVEPLFPGGPSDLIRFWSIRCDRQMEAAMAETMADDGLLAPSARVARATRLRIEAYGGERETVRRTIAHLALPANAVNATRILYRTVDSIWYAAGDRSVDISFYGKRASLATIYAATLLYWLDDESEDCVATWGFLDRRLAGAERLSRLGSTLTRVAQTSPISMLGQRLAAFRNRAQRSPGRRAGGDAPLV